MLPYFLVFLINFLSAALSAAFWSVSALSAAQLLRQLYILAPHLHLFKPHWYRIGLMYGFIASFFIILFFFQAATAILWIIVSKWMIIGQRQQGRLDWDQSSYCQRWQLHLSATQFIVEGGGAGGVLASLTGSTYYVWYLRAMGAKIGKNCAVFAGGKPGLMTEPDLVEVSQVAFMYVNKVTTVFFYSSVITSTLMIVPSLHISTPEAILRFIV